MGKGRWAVLARQHAKELRMAILGWQSIHMLPVRWAMERQETEAENMQFQYSEAHAAKNRHGCGRARVLRRTDPAADAVAGAKASGSVAGHFIYEVDDRMVVGRLSADFRIAARIAASSVFPVQVEGRRLVRRVRLLPPGRGEDRNEALPNCPLAGRWR